MTIKISLISRRNNLSRNSWEPIEKNRERAPNQISHLEKRGILLDHVKRGENKQKVVLLKNKKSSLKSSAKSKRKKSHWLSLMSTSFTMNSQHSNNFTSNYKSIKLRSKNFLKILQKSIRAWWKLLASQIGPAQNTKNFWHPFLRIMTKKMCCQKLKQRVLKKYLITIKSSSKGLKNSNATNRLPGKKMRKYTMNWTKRQFLSSARRRWIKVSIASCYRTSISTTLNQTKILSARPSRRC